MPPKAQSEIVDIDVELLAETPSAFKVKSINTGKEAWVPQSLAEYDGSSRVYRIGTLTLPRWAAEQKGLI